MQVLESEIDWFRMKHSEVWRMAISCWYED